MDSNRYPPGAGGPWSRLRSWFQASLANRATAMGLGLASAVLLCVFLLVFKLGADLVRQSVNERLASAAALNAARLEAEIGRLLSAVDKLAHRPAVVSTLARPASAAARLPALLDEFRHGFPEIEALSLFDTASQIVVASAMPAARPDMTLLAAALQRRQATFALPVEQPGSRLHFAFPVLDTTSGHGVGGLVGHLDLLAVLSRLTWDGETADRLPMHLSVEAGGRILYRSAHVFSGEVLRVGVPLGGRLADSGLDFRLMVEVGRDAAYAAFYRFWGAALLIGAIALFLIVVLVRKMAENILRPLKEMSEHAKQVAGAGPAGLRELAVQRSDELGAMGMAFNEMVRSLRLAYETQEAEVQRRTRQLAEARERLSRVLAGIDDVVYAMDDAWQRLDYISPSVARLFGLSPELCLAEPACLYALIEKEDRPRLREARRQLVRGASTEVRYRIRRPDGSLRWVKDRFHLVHDAERGRVHVSGLISDVTARVEAEASLLLRDRALASSSCGVVITDMMQAGHPILYVNNAFERITGYAASEVLGRNCAMLQSDKAENAVSLAEIRAAIAEARDCKVVIRNYRKNGDAFWNELQLSPIIDQDGRVTHYIGIQNDITANILATQALVDSEQRLALTIEALHEGVWDWHIPEDRFITSPSWSEILGIAPRLAPPEAGFALFIRHVPEAWVKRVQSELDAHLAGDGSEFYLEHQMCHADGRSIWVANHGRIVERDRDGRPRRMVGTIVDITQRVESSQQIMGLMGQLDSIFTLSPDAFVYFNEAGQVTFVNPAFERLTGIKAGESIGLSEGALRSLLQERSDPAHSFPWFGASGTRDPQEDHLLYLLRPTRRVLLVSRRGDEGCAAVLYLRDVTRENEVDRMKSEFLSTAAHELRTPMASIMGFAELLMLRDFSPERTRDMLSTIHRQARRLTDLVNELLDLARIESRAGKDFRISRQSIAPVIRDAVAALHVEGDRSRMQVNLPESLPELDIDPAKMQQAIINVLSNAYKYSPQGGPIQISAWQRERGGACQVAIVVRDHGIGMSAEQVARVFERFFRADPSGNIPGTGLGMSLVKEIMEHHGGSVEVDSEPGQGTSVLLWLPVPGMEAVAMSSPEVPGCRPALRDATTPISGLH
ncbi:MAG: PAS domain S-box protein [Azonexus sp.]